MNFISNRDIVVRSKITGHALSFKKNVPTYVPFGMHAEVIEKGILPVDEAGASVAERTTQAVEAAEQAAKPKVFLAPEDANERSQKILDVFKALVKRNNSSDFNAGGTPAAAAVTAALGWKVDQKEVRSVWEKHREGLLLQGPVLALK